MAAGRAEDPAAHHQLTDPAADHPCLAPDPAALVAAAAAPGAGCPDHCYQRSGSVPVVLAPDPAALVADLRQRILPQLLPLPVSWLLL